MMSASPVTKQLPNIMTTTITHAPRATVFFKYGTRYQARLQFANIENAQKYLSELRPVFRDDAKIEMRPYFPIVKYTPERKRNMSFERTKGIDQSQCSRDLAWKEKTNES